MQIKYKAYQVILLCVLSILSIHIARAQGYKVSGKVQDETGAPLVNAVVELHENLSKVIVGAEGQFQFTGIKPGKYHLDIYASGYAAQYVEFTVVDKDILVDVEMFPASLEISGAVIEESILKSKNRESSLQVDMVDRKFLDRNAGSSFVGQLDNLPGINVISTGSGVSKPVIRGFSFNRVIVADKGIKQQGQQWGWDHGLEIDQFDVDRAEIIRGPASLQYGSDAIGGVIHIRFPEFPERNSLHVKVLGTYRSVNQLGGQSVQVSGRTGSVFVAARFSSQDFADYSVPADTFLYNTYKLPIFQNRLKNTAGRERNFSVFAALNKSWGYTTITVSRFFQEVGFFAGAHGIPKAYKLEDDGKPRNIDLPSQQVTHWKAISNSNIRVKGGRLEIDLGFQENLRKEFSYPHAHGGFYVKDTTNTEHLFDLFAYTANIRYQYNQWKNATLSVGWNNEILENKVGGFSYLLPDYFQAQTGIFVYFSKQLSEKVFFNIGGRFDYTRIEVKPYDQLLYNQFGEEVGSVRKVDRLTRNFFNGSGATGISWMVNKRTTLKWNLGSSYRNPTVPELTADGIHHGTFRHEKGDSTLTPERAFQFDFMVDHRRKDWFIAFTPFFYYIHQYIYLNPTGEFSPLPDAGQLYKYAQANALQTGAELQADWHFLKHFHLTCVMDMAFGLNLDDLYPLPFIPPAMANIEFEYTLPVKSKVIGETFLRVVPKFAAPQFYTARNEKPTNGYALLNLGAGTEFKFKHGSFDLLVEVQNVTNTTYMVHMNRYRILNLPEPGINVAVTGILKIGGVIPSKKNP